MKKNLPKINKKYSVLKSNDTELNRIQQEINNQFEEISRTLQSNHLELTELNFRINPKEFVYIEDQKISIKTPSKPVLGVCVSSTENSALVAVSGIVEIDPEGQKPDDFDSNVAFTPIADNLIKLAGGSSVPTNVNNLTGDNISPNLTDAQKRVFRLRIGALGIKMEDLVNNLTDAEKTAIKTKLGISDSASGQRLFLISQASQLPSSPAFDDLMITTAKFSNPGGAGGNFEKGGVYEYRQAVGNNALGWHPKVTERFAFSGDLSSADGRFYMADAIGDLPSSPKVGDVLVTTAQFVQTRRRPDLTNQNYTFRKGEVSHYLEADPGINSAAGFYSISNRRFAFTDDIPTVPSLTNFDATNFNQSLNTTQKEALRDIMDAMDRKLDDLSSTLSSSEKDAILTKLDAMKNNLSNLVSTLNATQRLAVLTKLDGMKNDMSNLLSTLSDANKSAIRTKIDAGKKDLSEVPSTLTDSEKTSVRNKIGARASNYKIVSSDILSSMTNAQKTDFQNRIGVQNSPPPETVTSAGQLAVDPLNPFKRGELRLMQNRFSITRTTLGSAKTGKDLDLSVAAFFDSLNIETVFGAPSRMYVAHGASSLTALTVTQDVNGNDTLGNQLNEAIVLDADKNSFVLRGASFGSSRILIMDDGVGNSIEVYYTASTKPAGATNNWERTITVTSGGGNLKGFCCDEARDILYVMPSVGSTILAYKFSTGTAMPTENIALTHASSPNVNDLEFHKDCVLVQDDLAQQVYVYDSYTKQYSSRNSFVFRSTNDEFNTLVKLGDETLYSYIYENELLYAYNLGEFQGGYSEADLGRAILEYQAIGWIPVFNSGQKATSSSSAPTVNVENGDIWFDTSDTSNVLTYYRANNKWIALSPDPKMRTVSSSMDKVERDSFYKKLGINGEFTHSDNADNLEDNRAYFMLETASKTPVAHERFFILNSGRKQTAFSLDDGSTYTRLENESYTNYGDETGHPLTPVDRFSNSTIFRDVIRLFRSTTTGAPFGQSGLMYGTRLVVGGEIRYYQVALTLDRLFYRYSTSESGLTTATWIEGSPDELFVQDVSQIANFNPQIWLIKEGDHGDSDKIQNNNYLRAFQRVISGSIITETLYVPKLDASNVMQISKVSRVKSERFLLSNWTKDYGQMVPSPSNHPPDTDRVWYDTGSKEVKRFYTETATRGVRNEETEFTVDVSGVLGAFLKDDSNRLYYFFTASGAARNLRAYTFLGERDSTKDINIGLQNNSFLCTGGTFDSLNQRVLVVDGNNLSTTRRVYAYSPIDQSYISAGNIQLHGITRYNLFYGGFALRSVGETNRVGTAGALGSMNGLAYRASTDQLLSISNSSRNIFVVNQTTGVALRVGNAGALGTGGWYSLAVVNDTIYAINSTTNTLMRVSEVDGTASIVQASGLPARSWASLTGHKNLLYAVSNSDNGLYEISPSEGVGRLIGILPAGDWEALGSDGENLFAINSTDDKFYTISDVNGSANSVSEESFLVSGRYTGLTYKPSTRKFFTNNGTSLYEVDTSTIAKLYLLGRHTGDSTRHEIVVFSLNSETYGQQLTNETIVLAGATNPTSIASNGEHIHVLDTVSNVDGIKGYTFAGARDTSKDITLHADNDTNAEGIIFNEGLVNVFDTTSSNRKVFSYTDSNTISFWDSIIAPRSIREDQLKVRIVGSDILKLNAVINENLADNAVATRNIQNGNVTNPKIGNNAVNHRTMATNAIENENILNETIGLEKLAVDGFPRSAIGITDNGQSLAYRHFPYLDKRTIEELPDIDSNDRDFYIPVLAGPSFTHGSTVSGASTSVQGFHQALAIDRNGTIAEFWRTSNATGQGHIRLSSIRGGSHADHTVSSFNNSTHIHMQSDGDYWWMMEFSNNQFKLHRLNSKAFYPLNSFTLSSSLFSTLFSSSASNFRGFAFMTPNTIIDGHGFSEIILATPNSAHILAFNTTNGFGASQHTIGLETLANITDCQGVAVAGRGHSHMYFVDSPSSEACKAFSTLDNSRVSGLDFTFSNAGTTRVALAGYTDFLINSWTNNNLSTGQVDGDQLVKKLRVNGNNKRIRTNSSGALITDTIT